MSRHGSKASVNLRNARKAVAEETLAILQQGGYLAPDGDWIDLEESLRKCTEGSFVLGERDDIASASCGSAPRRDEGSVKVEVTTETSLEAVYRLAQEVAGHVVVLNFASAKNPGGGFLGGAQAQEESLARSSGLYPCLNKFKDDLYSSNKKDPRGGFYSDDMIFSPDVPFFRTDDGALLPRPVSCSVITSPAVNAGVVAEGKRKGDAPVMQVMEGRLRRILRLARAQQASTLILGAWGCGVFRNAPQDVARLFDRALDQFRGAFARAVFAVPDEMMAAIFSQTLLSSAPTRIEPRWRWDGGYAAEAAVAAAAEAEDLEEPGSPQMICAPVDVLSRSVSPQSPPSSQLVSVDPDDDGTMRALTLKLVSFGYSRQGGLPAADLVFDARHIKNPQKGPQKYLTGLDARLRKEVMANRGAEEFLEQILQDVRKGIEEEREMVVAVGCTHGKHRSVTFCEEVARALQKQKTPGGRSVSVEVWHRERGSWSKKCEQGQQGQPAEQGQRWKGRWRRGGEQGLRFEGDDDDEED